MLSGLLRALSWAMTKLIKSFSSSPKNFFTLLRTQGLMLFSSKSSILMNAQSIWERYIFGISSTAAAGFGAHLEVVFSASMALLLLSPGLGAVVSAFSPSSENIGGGGGGWSSSRGMSSIFFSVSSIPNMLAVWTWALFRFFPSVRGFLKLIFFSFTGSGSLVSAGAGCGCAGGGGGGAGEVSEAGGGGGGGGGEFELSDISPSSWSRLERFGSSSSSSYPLSRRFLRRDSILSLSRRRRDSRSRSLSSRSRRRFSRRRRSSSSPSSRRRLRSRSRSRSRSRRRSLSLSRSRSRRSLSRSRRSDLSLSTESSSFLESSPPSVFALSRFSISSTVVTLSLFSSLLSSLVSSSKDSMSFSMTNIAASSFFFSCSLTSFS
mmetsp:Transcript_20695/g.38925  ORF Transcript_20695/g.38925 Transcript_20695/m.38925 type:complete len:377 (-) Transcript_20695:319-1449(-)